MLNALRNAVALFERLTGAFESRGVPAERAFRRIMSDDGLLARFVDVLVQDADEQAQLAAYATRFTAAVAAGKYDYTSDYLIPAEFPESVFGAVGEGLILAQPASTSKGYWTEKEVNDWLASADVAGKGLEAATLADLLAYGAEHPDEQRKAPIIAWGSLSRSGDVAGLGRGGGGRHLYVRCRDGRWDGYYRFLLRNALHAS